MKNQLIASGVALLSIAIMVYLFLEGQHDELYMFAVGSILGEVATLLRTRKLKINFNYKKVFPDGSE